MKECLAIYAAVSISGLRLTHLPEALGTLLGYPREVVLDDGPEKTSMAMFAEAQTHAVQLRFIQPGEPVQNALPRACSDDRATGQF